MMQHLSRSLRSSGSSITFRHTFSRCLSTAQTDATKSRVKLTDFERQIQTGQLAKANDITPANKWKRLNPAELFPEMKDAETRSELNKLKDIESQVFDEMSGKVVKEIDWKHWENEIRCPDLVMTMKKHYEGLELPDFEMLFKEKEKEIKDVFDPIIKDVEDFGKKMDEDIKRYEERLQEVNSMQSGVEELAVEDWLDKNPDCRKEIEDDIENNRWFLTEPEPDIGLEEEPKPAVLTAKP